MMAVSGDDLVNEWRNRTAVVTGGGRGFGAAFGRALAREGATVVLVDTDEAAVTKTAAALSAEGGAGVGLLGDVTDEGRMHAVMTEAAAMNGGIDLLINNAGLHSQEYAQGMQALGVEKTRRLFDVNVLGTVTCTLAAVDHMRGRAGANIVNIASAAAHLGPRTNAYGVSKMAVGGLTLAFAGELGPDGIRVNAISPGMIFTDTIQEELSPANKKLAKGLQIIDADGEEADVVEALLYLSSSRARFVTGEILRVTGGMGAGL